MNLDAAMAATAAILFLVALVAAFLEDGGRLVLLAALAGLAALSLAFLGHIVDRRNE